MNFSPIDMKQWYRVQTFMYFSQMAPTNYSLTVNVDVTKLRQTLKAHEMKFYPAYLWLVTKHLNEQQEFKIAEKDGQIGYFDILTPFYAVSIDIALKLSVSLALSSSTHCYGEKKKLRSGVRSHSL